MTGVDYHKAELKRLLHETFSLIGKHLRLWLPCCAAAILMLALDQLNTAGIHWLLRTLSTTHSVFGGGIQERSIDQVIEKAYAITIPFALLRQFAEICFFVAALVTTGALVQRIYNQENATLAVAVGEVRAKYREALFFSLKYMLTMGATGGILVFLTTSPQATDRLHQLASSKAILFILGLAVEGCLGWLLIPSAIRLLRPPDGRAVSPHARQIGTILAVVTAAATLGLQFLVGNLEATTRIESQWEGEAVAVINTLVLNVPNLVLFVALALLAVQREDQETPIDAELEAS